MIGPRRSPPSLGLLAAALLTASCQQGLTPLSAPLAPGLMVEDALRIVVSEADLEDLSELVRKSPGNKLVVIPLPPLALPGAPGGMLSASTATAEVGAGQAGFGGEGIVSLRWPVALQTSPLSLELPGGGSCGLLFQAPSSTELSLALRFGRSSDGQARVVLAKASDLGLAGATIGDPSGCLQSAAPGAGAAIVEHVSSAVRGALVARFDAAATAALRILIGVDLEQAGQLTAEVAGRAIALRISSRFVSPADPAAGLLAIQGTEGHVRLRVGLDVDRHPCARDDSPPGLSGSPLGPIAPPAPSEAAVLRRAFVIDRAFIRHFAWAVARSGALCRSVGGGVEAELPSTWAGDVLPPLASWVGGGPVGARFWPGASPALKVSDHGDGAALEWVLPEALLEVTASMGGLEVVVLAVRGQFRLTTALTSLGPGGLSLDVRDAAVDSAVATSPLLAEAPKPSEEALATLVRRALMGIFEQDVGLGEAKGMSKVVGTARDGENMWVWLDAGALSCVYEGFCY